METKKTQPPINVDFFEDLTGEIKRPPRAGTQEIGQRIRELREQKGLSLESLSHMTGFDVNLLASIEDQQVQPQLGTLMKLSKALDSAFGRLLSGVGRKLYSVTRKSERRIVQRSTSQKGQRQLYTYMSLAPEVRGRHMEALIVELAENPEQNTSVHEGEEFIYVLKGTVVVRIADETFSLYPGDSIYYLSTTPHLIAAKQTSATVLAVLYEG